MSKLRVAFVVLVVIAVTIFNAKIMAIMIPNHVGVDFTVFARTLTQTPQELYTFTETLPFVHPPTAILPIKAMASLGLLGFTILSAAAYFFAIKDKAVAGLSLLSQSASKGLQYGQIPMILAAATLFGLRMPPFWGGAIWGVVASVKPQLMLFAPLALLARRDWRMFFGMVAGGCASLAVALLAFGISPWFDWLSSIAAFSDFFIEAGKMTESVTPPSVAVAAGMPKLPFMLFGVFLGGMAVWFAAARLEGELLVGLIVGASLAVSPYGNIHDAIAVIPACVILMLRGQWIYAVPAGLIFFGTPLFTAVGLIALLVLAIRSAAAVPARHEEMRLV